MKKVKSIINFQKGFSIVEVILATSLFGILVTALLGAYLYGEESIMQGGAHDRALLLAQEGLEASRILRDADFANLVDGSHGLGVSAGQYILSGTTDTTDIYTRSINIKSIDADRKEIKSEVTWQKNPVQSGKITLLTQLTNFRAVLADWSNPFQESFFNIAGNQNATKIQVLDDVAYIIRANANTANFYAVDIQDPALPVLLGSVNISGTPQNIFVSGDFAYVTSNADNRELQIIDITNPALPAIIGAYDDLGTDDARGVYVVGTKAYVSFAAGVDFAVIDITDPALPVLSGSLDIANVPNELVVSGNYAYVTSSSNTGEVLVFSIAAANPTLVATLNLPGNTDANTISYLGDTLYVGQGNTVRLIDISNPLAPQLISSALLSTAVTDLALDLGGAGDLIYLSNSDNVSEFQVVDVSDKNNPVVFGVVDTEGADNLNGIAYSPSLDRAFGVSDANAQELRIFAPK